MINFADTNATPAISHEQLANQEVSIEFSIRYGAHHMSGYEMSEDSGTSPHRIPALQRAGKLRSTRQTVVIHQSEEEVLNFIFFRYFLSQNYLKRLSLDLRSLFRALGIHTVIKDEVFAFVPLQTADCEPRQFLSAPVGADCYGH